MGISAPILYSPMSDKSSTALTNRISSRLSRVKNRFYSVFPSSPTPAASPQNDTAPVHSAKIQHSSVSISNCQPVSIATSSAASPLSVYPSTSPRPSQSSTPSNLLKDFVSYPSTHLAPPPQPEPTRTQKSIQSTAGSNSENYYGQGMFHEAENIYIANSNFIDNSTTSDNFMEKFLQQTIIGAEFDSSDRDPPPRCHPGTRLAIISRCKAFFEQCDNKEKLRWLVGAAGVGKSAIMQVVAEEIPADASIFLSVNGRQDGTKTFTTIAYQLAAKCQSYRQYVREEFTRDPSLFRKSLPTQFQMFIVEPFINQHLFNPSHRFLIIIDGLDECNDPLVQRELLRLISRFCITYPTSPVVWIVASRPEPHIVSFFNDVNVAGTYIKEEITIDSDEACRDVQKFLRDALKVIKLEYPTLKHKQVWPAELEFTKIATAAGGLFAYASTVVRYIDDPYYGDPVSQLGDVLVLIDADRRGDSPRKRNPLAQLDALYERILTKIPSDIVDTTRKILLFYMDTTRTTTFRLQCNLLGLTEGAAYSATRHIHSVSKIPEPAKADKEDFAYLHKSFIDYICDYERSKFFQNVEDDALQLQAQSSLRVVEQVPRSDFENMASGEGIVCGGTGILKYGPGFCDNIVLSWPGDERFEMTDDELRIELYRTAMETIRSKYKKTIGTFYNDIACFHALTTLIIEAGTRLAFSYYDMSYAVFVTFRSELMALGKLKQVPLQTLDYSSIIGPIDIMLKKPIGTELSLSLLPGCKCSHDTWELEALAGPQEGWEGLSCRVAMFYDDDPEDDALPVTESDLPRFNIDSFIESHLHCFESGYVFVPCETCIRPLASYWIDSPDNLVTVFADATGLCFVEASFVDPDDTAARWCYRFFHSGLPTSIDI